MLKIRNFKFCFFLFLLFGCNEKKTPEFYFTENGLKYKYHDIVTDGIKPKTGDYLNVYMELKNAADSVFYSSTKSQLYGIESLRLGNSKISGGIEEGFLKLNEGDSVTFYLPSNLFFKHYLKIQTPSFLKHDEELRITLRLINVLDSVNQEINRKELISRAEFNEDFLIQEMKNKWALKYDTILKYGDVFIVPLDSKTDRKIKIGDVVKIDYQCKTFNNHIIYSTYSSSPDEFVVGLDGQMIEGFNYILQQINHGDHILAMIPSYLGFKSIGSSNGLVSPYTPLIFEIKVVD